MEKRGSWYKSLVLNAVDNWLEGISLLSIILVVYASIQLIRNGLDEWGVGLLIVGIIVIFLCSWIFFCIIETRDLLKSIEENTRGGLVQNSTLQNDNNTQIQQVQAPLPPTPAYDEKYCPNCNSIIKKTAKKCRFCNTWLNEKELKFEGEE